MDEPIKTGHVYPAGAEVFSGTEGDAVYRARNALLVKALRSGAFTQARGTLEAVRYNGYQTEVTGHCCLGVACRVAEFEADGFTVISRTSGGRTRFGTMSVGGEGNRVVSSLAEGYPPTLVKDWFGWYEANPNLWVTDTFEDGRHTAAHLNDNLQMSFDRIADAFERTFVTFTYKSVDDLTDDTEMTVSDLPE